MVQFPRGKKLCDPNLQSSTETKESPELTAQYYKEKTKSAEPTMQGVLGTAGVFKTCGTGAEVPYALLSDQPYNLTSPAF